MMGNFEAVVFFAIVAYLSTFFTKNMVFVFLIAILATNFLMASKVNYFKTANAKEGMKNKDAKDADAKDADAKPSPTPSTKPSPTPSTKPKPTQKKVKEAMNGKLAPAKFNNTNDESEDDDGDAAPFPSSNDQEARNVEKAHDNLQNIGGMNAQTEQVMQQQKILMDNMKTMQPFLETAERFLDKFNMKGLDGVLGKIGLGGVGGAQGQQTALS